MKLGKVGLIGRFKPIHIGGASLLEEVCKKAESVIIGIGSSNRYNLRNPFTAEESGEMIKLVLKNFSNYKIIQVPDSTHIPEHEEGKKWMFDVRDSFGDLDYFISGNSYVADLLKSTYDILHPWNIVPKENWGVDSGEGWSRLSSTKIREKMAQNEDWEKYVPNPVAKYLKRNGITERFKKEFGAKTLANKNNSLSKDESLDSEKRNVMEE